MDKSKEVFNLLNLKPNQSFRIIKPTFDGSYRLTDNLYIQKQISDNEWESSQFQLCDLCNGTVDIEVNEEL